jgi:hypothetical protein
MDQPSTSTLHTPLTPHSAPSTPASRHSTSTSSSLLETSSLLSRSPPSQSLARPFSFELKLQVFGKLVCDGHKVSLSSLQRFRPTIGSANTGSFKLWSTRIVSMSVHAEAPFPRTYEFRVPLPDNLPPSFRGSALSSLYCVHAVAVGSSHVGVRKLLDVKVPFRVRVGGGGGVVEIPTGLVTIMQHCLVSPDRAPAEPSPDSDQSVTGAGVALVASTTPPNANSSSTSPDTTPDTSSLIDPSASSAPASAHAHAAARPMPAPLQVYADSSTASTGSRASSRRNSSSSSSSAAASPFGLPVDSHPADSAPLTFNISKTVLRGSEEFGAHVVKLTLDQRFLRPGDTVRGHMDFSRAGIRCYRVAIALEQEERVAEDAALSAHAAPFTHKRTFATFHQYTVNTLSTHFLFCLPIDVVANFATDITAVTWRLQFKFITDVDVQPKHTWSFLPAPSTTHAEALLWTLPLTVLPHDDADVVKQKAIKTVLFSPQSFV